MNGFPGRCTSDLLVHPLVLASFALLAVNDHVLKVHHPGLLSGKLSDVAFMVAAPLWLHVGGSWLLGERVGARGRRVWLSCCVLGVGAFFTAMQLSAWGDAVYRHGLGLLQWPLRALASWLEGHGVAGLQPVQATPDPTDLACLPLLLVAYAVGRRAS